MIGDIKGVFWGEMELFEGFAEEVRPAVEITLRLRNTVHGLDVLQNGGPAIVFVDLSEDAFARLDLAQSVMAESHGVLAIPVATGKSPDVILEALRRGMADFIVWPEERGKALEIVRSALAKNGVHSKRGRVFSVFSMKGGQGATFLAANLADQIQAISGKDALLVDFNLYAGDAVERLGITPSYTPFDLKKDLRRVDRELLLSSLPKHERGFHVLGCPEEMGDADLIQAEDAARMIETLASHMDYILIDLPHDFSARTLPALEASDVILLPVQQDVAAIRSARKVLLFFRDLGYEKNKIKLIVNRVAPRGEIALEDIVEMLGLPVYGAITNDIGTMVECVISAKTVEAVNPQSDLNHDVKSVAASLAGVALPARRRSFWKRVFPRRTDGMKEAG
jgi:pilus assembly protein CpaE